MSDKNTPEEWQAEKGFVIRDPDGWRRSDAPVWDEPITEEEFDLCAGQCTISFIN